DVALVLHRAQAPVLSEAAPPVPLAQAAGGCVLDALRPGPRRPRGAAGGPGAVQRLPAAVPGRASCAVRAAAVRSARPVPVRVAAEGGGAGASAPACGQSQPRQRAVRPAGRPAGAARPARAALAGGEGGGGPASSGAHRLSVAAGRAAATQGGT